MSLTSAIGQREQRAESLIGSGSPIRLPAIQCRDADCARKRFDVNHEIGGGGLIRGAVHGMSSSGARDMHECMLIDLATWKKAAREHEGVVGHRRDSS